MKTYNIPATEIRSLTINHIICASPVAPDTNNSLGTGNDNLPGNSLGD